MCFLMRLLTSPAPCSPGFSEDGARTVSSASLPSDPSRRVDWSAHSTTGLPRPDPPGQRVPADSGRPSACWWHRQERWEATRQGVCFFDLKCSQLTVYALVLGLRKGGGFRLKSDRCVSHWALEGGKKKRPKGHQQNREAFLWLTQGQAGRADGPALQSFRGSGSVTQSSRTPIFSNLGWKSNL